MISIRSLIALLCAGLAASPIGCDRVKIVDDKSEEISPGDGRGYMVDPQKKEYQLQVEVNSDEECSVDIALMEGKEVGKVLKKAEKTKSVKLEATIPANTEVMIRIRVDKRCLVKTSIRSI